MQLAPVRSWWHRYAPYGACYLAWAAFSAGAFWCLLRLHEMLVALALLASTAAKVVPVLDRFSLVLLGLAWIAAIGILESYLTSGIRTGRPRDRIVRVAAIEAGFLCFSYAFVWLLGAVISHT
jgi:hypothetical protein